MLNMFRQAKIALPLLFFFISACTLQPTTTPPPVNWEKHVSQISLMKQWQLNGKLGFKAPAQGGSASIFWEQQDNTYQLQLRGPFGAGSAKIRGDEHQAVLDVRDEHYQRPPEELALQLIGLPIPVNAISWWARGVPSPYEETAEELLPTPEGFASGFTQAGWQLSFSNYQPTSAGTLPRKITGKFGQYSFKLVVSRWRFPQQN